MAHGRHHARTISRSEEEWETMREPFRKAYIDQDMSLKQATQHLAVQYGFSASVRQWERRKEHWNFTKYQKRETRQQFIEQALAEGRNMEEILNASDIPVEGPGGDDRANRRNWRRYVKRSRSRSRQSNSQPNSPDEGPRHSFEAPGGSQQEHHIVERMYDVNLPARIATDHAGALPDTMMLEATSAEGAGQSPVQLLVVSDVNAAADTNPAPEIFVSTWDDAMGGLQNHVLLPQMSFTNYDDFPFQPDGNIATPGNNNSTSIAGMPEHYENYQNYQQVPGTAVEQIATYSNRPSGEWSGEQRADLTYNTGPQQLYEEAENTTSDTQSFPQIELTSQDGFDQPFNIQPPVLPVTSRTRTATDYFQAITADPLTTDLSNMIDVYTNDIQRMVKNFFGELPRIDPKMLQKIEDGLQARHDLCLRTVSQEIEGHLRNKQRALESIAEKCRNLEQIMSEKGINTRTELRELKARSNPRQTVDTSAIDMPQWNVPINPFTL